MGPRPASPPNKADLNSEELIVKKKYQAWGYSRERIKHMFIKILGLANYPGLKDLFEYLD